MDGRRCRFTAVTSLPALSVERLLDVVFLAEIHSFLWADPAINGAEFDPGWNCRDHTVVLGGLLRLLGVEAKLRWGKCTFVQGPAGGLKAVGFGQTPQQPGGHTWLRVPDVGNLDLSPRLGVQMPHWRPLRSGGVVGNTWRVDGPSRLLNCATVREYEERIDRASHYAGMATAIYWVDRDEPFQTDMLVYGYAFLDSPLSNRLQILFDSTIYIKLIHHLECPLSE